MLDALTQRLASVVKTLRGHSRITEENVQEMLREVRLALLDADAGLPVVKEFVAKVKDKALGQEVTGSLTPGQALVGIVHGELVSLMGGASSALSFATQPPAVILLAGLQGSGKTTSAGKLARLIGATTKKKVLLVSTDVYRPAAIDQLATIAKNIGIELFPSDPSQKPVDIARAALDYAKRHFFDVLIVDTAGRLAIDQQMMEEVKALEAAVDPIETLFVVDSMQGQDAVNVARAFSEALPLTGIILTKLDGDSRGGAALSVRHVTGKPIKFVGVSEKMEGLEPFHPDRMASRILGMGDILSLVEEARAKVDEKEAQKLADKFKKGKDFDLEDFKSQLSQMKKMGGISSLADKLPTQITQMAQSSPELQEKALKRTEAIINSMTPLERRKPELLKASRKRRIAAGAGVQVQEVNRLLTQFEQMRKMMKMMRGGNLQRMLRNMKGMMPGMR
ncbi:MAG TPA: signal recognition particle protein [Usitatibacter sp.]|jgi:signal recognition particle subunit SRP54|nr:signal recognition particle protein [Usitatibacter sp.]